MCHLENGNAEADELLSMGPPEELVALSLIPY